MYYVGIDIGGTSIKAGLVDESGRVCELHEAPTPVDDLDDLMSTLAELFSRVRANGTVCAVGVGIPGLRSYATSVIETSPNIPCIHGVNLEDLLARKLGMPVITENDAKAGAYGEWACGAARGLQHLAYITIGTGLGCGLILHGKLFRGASGYAGELGHTTVELDGRACGCGSRGCLETRVSATAMVLTAREFLQNDPKGPLNDVRDSLTAKLIYDAAIQGDATAQTVFAETGRFLGIACANLVNFLNPQMIVIGGGVIASGELLLEPATAEARRRAFAPAVQVCPIVRSQLWPDAGLIGAAMLARDTHSTQAETRCGDARP
jgi:glucokinase